MTNIRYDHHDVSGYRFSSFINRYRLVRQHRFNAKVTLSTIKKVNHSDNISLRMLLALRINVLAKGFSGISIKTLK